MRTVKILEECQYLKDGEVLELQPGDTIELDDQRAKKWCKARRCEGIEPKPKASKETATACESNPEECGEEAEACEENVECGSNDECSEEENCEAAQEDDIEALRAEYQELYNKKPAHNIKIETLKEKIQEAKENKDSE